MIFKSRSERTIEEADAILDQLSHQYRVKMNAGTLTEKDREQIRPDLQRASDLMARAEGESKFSLLGPELDMLKRFLREGRFTMSDEEYIAQLRKLREGAEALLREVSSVE